MLCQIYTSQIGSDNIYPGLKTIFNDDNIHLSSCMVGEKVGSLSLYVSSTLQCESYNNISKRIMSCNALTGNITNKYSNHQWCDHINIVKDVQPQDVIYWNEYVTL
jgi:hypothetical protein